MTASELLEQVETEKVFSKDSYVYLKEGEFDRVFMVEKDWIHRPRNTFNPIEVYDIEKGISESINDRGARHALQLLPEERIAEFKKKVELKRKKDKSKDRFTLKKVRESLQAVFPDKWDLQSSPGGGTMYTLTIKFPKIEIVNGKGGKHNINDLYVRWKFGKGFTIKDHLEGVRGLVDYVEYKCGYAHSHLPHAVYYERSHFSTFCLGSGEFAQANSEWRMVGHQFTQEGFELLLYQLDAYVKWESLQGGPYIRIENIAIGDRCLYLGSREKKAAYEIIVKALKKFPLKFDNVNKRFKIEKFLLEPVISEIENIPKIKKTSAGEYLYGDVSRHSILGWIAEGNAKGNEKPILTFRGEKIFFKVMELKEDHLDSKLLEVAHPDLTQYAADKLTKNTNHYFIKKYGV